MAASYITDFIQSLSLEEIKIVRKYIKRSDKVHPSNESKIEKLLGILINENTKNYRDNTISNILECNPGAIRALKSRLFDKAQEALISTEYFETSTEFDSRELIVYSLKKKMLLVQSLIRKVNDNKMKAINVLLTDISITASKYQCYDILIDSHSFQKYLIGLREGIKEFELKNEQIAFNEDCLRSVRNANDAYYRLIINKEFSKTLSKSKLNDYVKNCIKQMEFDFKRTNAHQVNYYKYILEMQFHENKNDFRRAISICKKLLTLVKENIVCYSKNRIGFAIGNLTHYYIATGNYGKAATRAKTAQELYLPHSFNSLILKEQEFLANFYNKNYTEALKIINQLYKYSELDTGLFRKSKFNYYEAYTLFSIKKYKEALQLLNKHLEIEKDKAGWNIGLRVLITMIFIELNKKSEASTSIETLRKHIERTAKDKEITDRDFLILKLLRELEKDNFQRNEKNKNVLKLLAELSNKNKPTVWEHFIPELIPFHEWVLTLPAKQ